MEGGNSHASALIAGGWDVVEVAARLGHSSPTTTLKTYAHLFDQANRSEDRRGRLAAIYGGSAMEAPVEATDDSKARSSAVSEADSPRKLRAVAVERGAAR